MNNVICWFEIYVSDIERAKKFYHDVLGTEFHDMASPGDSGDMKMSCFSSPTDDSNHVSGALIEMVGMPRVEEKSPHTMVYFPCMDCSVEESRVENAGGTVFKTKMSLGEHGFCSICMDTEGNTFGLYSME